MTSEDDQEATDSLPLFPDRALFRFRVEECDVRSREKLAAFREHYASWYALFDQDRPHSIFSQITGMMWASAAYRLMNEARRHSQQVSPTAAVAPVLVELLDDGYIAAMVLAVCRLTDPPDRKPERNVISLRRALDDLRSHRQIVTREMFVCNDGLPFDWWRKVEFTPGIQLCPTIGPTAYETSELAHKDFDRLSKIAAKDRSRDDLISIDYLDHIGRCISGAEIDRFKALRNKFVAHAADPFSRSLIGEFPSGITFRWIDIVQKRLVVASSMLRFAMFWGAEGGPVPTPQFDILQHLDKPFVQPQDMQALQAWWDEHVREREAWAGAMHELF